MEYSEKWLARASRIARFSGSVSVRADDEIAHFIREKLQRNPSFAADSKKNQQRALDIFAAQELNGADLYVDRYLRNFLSEANNRILMGEGSKLPTSFNVIRAFSEPDDEALILRLLPEKIYSIGLGKILDFITNPKIDLRLGRLASVLEEFVIYEFNMFGGFSEIMIPGRDKYAFYGLAFVREHNELSIMAVVGRDNPKPSESKIKITKETFYPGKEFLAGERDEMDLSDEALFGNVNVQPILLLTRIDLEDMTVQVRYVLEEKRDSFIVFTDDPQILEDITSMSGSDHSLQANVDGIAEYSDLINFITAVPQFYFGLEEFSDDIVVERRPTKFRINLNSTKIRKLKSSLSNFPMDNYVLIDTIAESADVDAAYNVPSNNLQVEVSGYWKGLALGSNGADKFGRIVQGKSWVTKHSSWVERTQFIKSPVGAEVNITIHVDEASAIGYVYVLRSSMHPKNVYKIGYTVKTPDERAAQLSATSGQPDMFNVIQSWRVKNPRAIERHIHDILKEYRINQGREFFMLKYRDIRACIEGVIEQADAFIDE